MDKRSLAQVNNIFTNMGELKDRFLHLFGHVDHTIGMVNELVTRAQKTDTEMGTVQTAGNHLQERVTSHDTTLREHGQALRELQGAPNGVEGIVRAECANYMGRVESIVGKWAESVGLPTNFLAPGQKSLEARLAELEKHNLSLTTDVAQL